MGHEDIDIYAAGSDVSGKLCSICQTDVISGEKIVFCPHCNLPFHHECWQENEGCSAYGCKGAPETLKTGTPGIQTQAWGGEKPCPECGQEIKGQALKCRHCGASFDTRAPVSADEYSRREYEGKEYTKVRNILVVLFFSGATGCLAPIVIGVLIKLMFFGGLGENIEFRRFGPSMKVLCYITFAVSIFLLMMMVLVILFDT